MPEPLLRNSPLSTVVCEVRFDAPAPEASQILALGEYLGDLGLTNYAAEQGLQIQMGPGQLQPTAMQRYRFTDPDGSSTLTLDRNAFAYQTAVYEGIDGFLEIWEPVASAVRDSFNVQARTRVGLRYTNEVTLTNDQRQGVADSVNEELLPPWAAQPHLQDMSVSLHELRFVQEEGELAFRHGLHQQGGTAPPTYLLDYDHYEQRLRSFDVAAEADRLRRFNATVYDVFRWSITEQQYTAFDPEERPDA
jgi:uncharacterized protein (TIGR04255 family)